MKTKGRVVDETMVLTDLMRSLTIKDFVMPDIGMLRADESQRAALLLRGRAAEHDFIDLLLAHHLTHFAVNDVLSRGDEALFCLRQAELRTQLCLSSEPALINNLPTSALAAWTYALEATLATVQESRDWRLADQIVPKFLLFCRAARCKALDWGIDLTIEVTRSVQQTRHDFQPTDANLNFIWARGRKEKLRIVKEIRAAIQQECRNYTSMYNNKKKVLESVLVPMLENDKTLRHLPDPDAFQALFASAFPDGKMTRLSYKAFLDAHSPKNKK